MKSRIILFCPQCQLQIPNGFGFCPRCKTQLDTSLVSGSKRKACLEGDGFVTGGFNYAAIMLGAIFAVGAILLSKIFLGKVEFPMSICLYAGWGVVVLVSCGYVAHRAYSKTYMHSIITVMLSIGLLLAIEKTFGYFEYPLFTYPDPNFIFALTLGSITFGSLGGWLGTIGD